MPTADFSVRFLVQRNSGSTVIRFTDASTATSFTAGNFKVTYPDGSVVQNTDYGSPDISAKLGTVDYTLKVNADNSPLTGNYTVLYTIIADSSQDVESKTFNFEWVEPNVLITNTSDVAVPEVKFKDTTDYDQGNFTEAYNTWTLAADAPSTSDASGATATANLTTSSRELDTVYSSSYYEGSYTPTATLDITWTSSVYAYLTVNWTKVATETFAIKKAQSQSDIIALLNTYKSELSSGQKEEYDYVVSLYSHLIGRAETGTLDGSESILNELLDYIDTSGSYTYQSGAITGFSFISGSGISVTGTPTSGQYGVWTSASAMQGQTGVPVADITGQVPVSAGGTGASTATGARTNLGLSIGSDVQAYSATLDGWSGFDSDGILVQTAPNTFTSRSIVGTTNRITISNGNGLSANPSVDISSSYVGQASITTLGTITTGVWNAGNVTAPVGTFNSVDIDSINVDGTTINSSSSLYLSGNSGASQVLIDGSLLEVRDNGTTGFVLDAGLRRIQGRNGGTSIGLELNGVVETDTGVLPAIEIAGFTGTATALVNRPLLRIVNGNDTALGIDADNTIFTNATHTAGISGANDLITKGYADENYATGGDVTKVGTPVDTQIGVWTGDGTLEGDGNLTWESGAGSNGNRLTITGTDELANGYIDILRDSSPTERLYVGAISHTGSSINNNVLGIYSTGANTNQYLGIQTRIESGGDTGAVPVIQFGTALNTGSAITTRPLMAGYNYTTKLWQLSAGGDWDYQGNNLTNIGTLGAVASADINGGTIDGTTIGGTTAAAGSFTTVNASSTGDFVGVLRTKRTSSNQYLEIENLSGEGRITNRNEVNSTHAPIRLYGINNVPTTVEYAEFTETSAEVPGTFTALGSLTASSLATTGNISSTGSRVSTGYFTNITSTNAVSVDSDKRLKKKIRTIELATETVKKINPVTFQWKDKSRGQGTQYGVVAQELQKVLPELVKEDETLAVSYGELIPILLKSIQELEERISKLETK